jgi:hypothetical protein
MVNGEMSLRRLKLSIYEVVTPREGGGGGGLVRIFVEEFQFSSKADKNDWHFIITRTE